MPDIFDRLAAEQKQVVAQEKTHQPDAFDRIAAETAPPIQGTFGQRMGGALVKGLMNMSRGIRYLPKHMAKTLETGKKHYPGPSYAPAGYDPKKIPAAKVVSGVKEWYNNALNREDASVQRMMDRHPEWETAPPENFLDLVSSPDKLAVAVTEALPLLVVAGLATAAGQPHVAATLVFSAEGQSGYDTALADGQSEEMAEKAYFMYGSVATALELMQLKGLIKVGKKAHAAVLKKAVGKLGKAKEVTKAVLKTAVEEALEEQAQGTWGEATSYILYGKKPEGGVKGFIDRRLQEGLIAATMAGGSAVGGVTTAMLTNGRKKASAKDIKNREAEIEKAIKDNENLSPDEKVDMLAEFEQIIDGVLRGEFDVTPDESVANASPEKQLEAAEAITDSKTEAIAETQRLQGLEYEQLLELVEKGDDLAASRIQEMAAEEALEESLPSYEVLMAQVVESGDEVAATAILNGEFKGGRARNEALQVEGRIGPDVPPINEQVQKFASIKVHSLARLMDIKKKDRQKIQVDLVGAKSMKDMTLEEARKVEGYFVAEAKKRGLVTSTGVELAEYVKGEVTQRGIEKSTGTRPSGWKAIANAPGAVIDNFLAGSIRIERLCEALDGFTEGPIYNSIWRPVHGALVNARMAHNDRVAKFRDALVDIMTPELDTPEGLQTAQETIAEEDKAAGKKARKLSKRAVRKLVGDSLWARYITGGEQTIVEATATEKAYRLSPSQKIGAFLAMKNEDSLNHLRNGNLKEYSNPDAVLIKVIDSITPQERAIAEWILNDLEMNFDRANQAAVIGLGRQLEQQDNYFPIKVIDLADMKTEDFLDELENRPARGEFKSEPAETKKRVKGASQPLKLDAFEVYLNHTSRIEQFIHMAPTAKSAGSILNTREFRQSVNRVTSGHGSRILDKWLKDCIKGHAAEQSSLYAKTLLLMRQKGVIYSLAANVPSMARQFISGFGFMAMHPSLQAGTIKYIISSAVPGNFEKMEARMKENSGMMLTRNFERELAYAKEQAQVAGILTGKEVWSNRALMFQRWADNRTTTIVWNAAYDAALNSEAAQKQFELDGSEEAAKYFADKMVMRTQPMGDVEHLPDFFRAGPIERLLTTFQNQPNNNLNFWAHDIVGAYKAGKIDKKMVAYRALYSTVLPSMMFGAISRGGVPDDWKDSLFDFGVYMTGPVFFIGRIFTDSVLGFAGGQTSVEDIIPANFAKGLQSGIKAIVSTGDERQKAARKSVAYNLKTIGGLTGRGPNAFFRTGAGIRDLYTGETDDWRRLIYSDWSLTNYGWPGGEEEKKTKRMTY